MGETQQLARVEAIPSSLAERPEQIVARIVEARALVVKIQKEIMQAGTHFGVLPGTDKPMLLKDGAELLNQAFRFEGREEGILDLGSADERKFQVTVGIYNSEGRRLGFGVGVCSTSEDKYKWRKAWKSEYEATPVDRRRTKEYPKRDGQQGVDIVYQVRTEPADLENTVLQMATKRGYVQATRQVHAISDVFADIGLEDLPEAQRDALTVGGRKVKKPQPKPKGAPPQGGKPPAPGNSEAGTKPAESAGTTAPAAASTPPAASAEREPGADDEAGGQATASMVAAEAWEQVKAVWHERGVISLAQSKRLYAIARDNGWGGADLDREIFAGLAIKQDEEGKFPIPSGKPYDLVVGIFSHKP